MLFVAETSDQTVTKGTHYLYLYTFSLRSPDYLALPSLLPWYSLNNLGRKLLNQQLFSTFFPISAQVSPVSHIASATLVFFFALIRLSSALPAPFTLWRILELSSSPFPLHYRSLSRLQSRPCSCLRYCSRFRRCSRPRSRPRSHLVFVLWAPAPFPFLLPPRSVSAPALGPILRSVSRLHPRSRSRSVSSPFTSP